MVPLTVALAAVNFTSTGDAQRAVSEFIHAHVTLSDNEWGGYSFLSNVTLFFIYFAPNVSLPDANATITPLFNVLQEVGNGTAITQLVSFDSFFDLEHVDAPVTQASQVGNIVEISSRLLSRDTALNKADDTARILLSFPSVAIK